MEKNKSLIVLIIFNIYIITIYIILVGGVSGHFAAEYYRKGELLSEIIALFLEPGYLNYKLLPVALFLTIWAFFSKKSEKNRAILLFFILLLSMFTITIPFVMAG